MTNFEKIKNMSVGELADKLDESVACDRCPIEKFCKCVDVGCIETWIKWLESEVEE